MDDKVKVYEPEVIQENPFPNEEGTPLILNQGNPAGNTFTQAVSKEKTFPKKRIAVELLSQALNTRSKRVLQEFTLAASGGFQIGNFEEGVTGDLRITPNGLTARDKAGITTFAIDGTDGSAIFKGTIQSGSIITGEVIVGDNRLILTVDSNGKPQIILNDGSNDRVLIGYQSGGF